MWGWGRTWGKRSVLGAVLVCLALGSVAYAEKKKPGLFDFDLRWRTPQGHQREAAKQLAPHDLDLTPAVALDGGPRKVRIRVYADPDYRSMTVRWRKRFEAHIERLNRVVGAVFNAHLVIESFREWERSHTGLRLESVLTELQTLDPGRDVDWVVGLVTPFKGVATSIHEIGWAQYLSRHLVLRGMDDEEESLAIDREFALLSAEERGRVYGERKAHKEIVVFLHEWGHTMGALHVDDQRAIMHPNYDAKRFAFSDFHKALISVVLERRLAAPDQAFPESAAVAALLTEASGGEGTPRERAALIALAEERSRSKTPGAAVPNTEAPKAPPSVTPADVQRPLDKAAALVKRKDPLAAFPLLVAVAPLIGSSDARAWVRLAELAASVGSPSMAEAAVGHLERDPERQKLAELIEAHRALVALPSRKGNWGLVPDDEAKYSVRYLELEELIARDGTTAVRPQVIDFKQTFPTTPGGDVLECELEMRVQRLAPASRACESALKKSDRTKKAHHLLGLIAVRQHRDAVAEHHLRRAIQMDPRDPSSWRELARLYRAAGARGKLTDLEAQHRALLSTGLPE